MDKPIYNTPTGDIYKINVTFANSDFSFFIGQKLKAGLTEVEICEIERDENNFYLFGILRYNIYAIKKESKEKVIYRTFEGIPVSLTYSV